MNYLYIDLDQGTSTVVLCDVYCYCLIGMGVLMCNSSSLVTSTHSLPVIKAGLLSCVPFLFSRYCRVANLETVEG